MPSRHGGAPYNYFRPGLGAKPIAFGRGHQNDPKIRAAWKALIAGQAPAANDDRQPIHRTRAGTWDEIIEAYLASSAFTDLKDKSANTRSLKIIREVMQAGTTLVVEQKADEIATFIDIIKNNTGEAQTKSGIAYGGYGTAKNLRNVWSLLYQVAMRKGLVSANPIRDIERPKAQNRDGHADWSDDEIAQYRRAHPKGTLPRLAFDAALETGMRVSDLAVAGRAMIRKDAGGEYLSFIPVKTSKHGEQSRCTVPISTELQDTLAKSVVVGQATWLVGSAEGKPMKAHWLSQAFGKWIERAGLPEHCVAHGLRKSFVRRLIDRGAAPTDVAAMTGHQDMALVMFYAAKRDRQIAGLRNRDAINMAA